MKNGEYRLLELNKEKKRATLCSASKEEIKTHKYPRWTYERRDEYNTEVVDEILKTRAEIRGYKVVPDEERK